MDDIDKFTQKYLENAQNRSKKLGISNMSKVPLTPSNSNKATPSRQASLKSRTASPKSRISTDKKYSSGGGAASPSVKTRAVAVHTATSNGTLMEVERKKTVSIDTKENVDLALEINITTGPNVQVQVEVEEQEIDGEGNVLSAIQTQRKQMRAMDHESATPSAYMRESARNHLHRLNELYANPQNLSSPVHRTEAGFTLDQDAGAKGDFKLKPRTNKLNEIMQSRNEWEDEANARQQLKAAQPFGRSHVDSAKSSPAKTGAIPKKYTAPSPRKMATTSNGKVNVKPSPTKNDVTTKSAHGKHITFEKDYMDSLEMQGFKRRDTSHKRLEYDFDDNPAKSRGAHVKNVDPVASTSKAALKTTTTPTNAGLDAPKNDAKPPLSKKVDIIKGLVSGRAAIFETQQTRTVQTAAAKTNQKDPAEMSLKERMALFEKNKGTALIPKAPLGIAASLKQIMGDLEQKHSDAPKPVITSPQQPIITSKSMTTSQLSKISNYNTAPQTETKANGMGIRQAVEKLQARKATISESKIASETRRNREADMNVVLNRMNFNRFETDEESEKSPIRSAPPPPAPPMPDNLLTASGRKGKRTSNENFGAAAKVRSSLEDVKRIRSNPPKEGRLYPSLTDIESGESTIATSTDDDAGNPVLERFLNDSYMESETDDQNGAYHGHQYTDEDEYGDYSQDDEGSHQRAGRRISYADSSISSTNSNDLDKCLDEAIDAEDDDDSEENCAKGATTYQNGTISSNSFCYKRRTSAHKPETIYEDERVTEYAGTSQFNSPIKSKLTVNQDDNNGVQLTHTVSFYRRQQSQNQVPSSPARRVLQMNGNEIITEQESSEEDNNVQAGNRHRRPNEEVEDKIRSLSNMVDIQKRHIAQTSNALNTCAATFEFANSSESVTAERLLLVATHSLQAARNEIQRIHVDRCIRSPDAPKECGRLTIKEITLPLSQDYITKLSKDEISGHHLVCLLKYNERVVATKSVPTLPGLLSVKFPDALQLDNVYADFKVTLEIYGMIAQREFLPHNVKYHIKSNKKGIIKTPKGKKPESRLINPPMQSPGGPNVVRTPSFVQYGFVIFSLREANRSSWTMNKVSNVSPLVGIVHMKVNCALSVNIDHKSFLTMFEDVSGFGAWHRRWCRLHGNVLSFWKYPDDERKPPIGSIDLTTCEQTKITTAPREMCARLNTLLIELKRPCEDDDRDSMFMKPHGDYTIVRYLLSADTKEERNEWCAHFNKSLALMRAWGPADR